MYATHTKTQERWGRTLLCVSRTRTQRGGENSAATEFFRSGVDGGEKEGEKIRGEDCVNIPTSNVSPPPLSLPMYKKHGLVQHLRFVPNLHGGKRSRKIGHLVMDNQSKRAGSPREKTRSKKTAGLIFVVCVCLLSRRRHPVTFLGVFQVHNHVANT